MPTTPTITNVMLGSRHQDSHFFIRQIQMYPTATDFHVEDINGHAYRTYKRSCDCHACRNFFNMGLTGDEYNHHADPVGTITANTVVNEYTPFRSYSIRVPVPAPMPESIYGLFDTVDSSNTEVAGMLTLTHRGMRETPKYIIADRYGRTFRAKKELGLNGAIDSIRREIKEYRRSLRRRRHYTEERQPGYYYDQYIEKYTQLIKEGKKPVSRKRHIAAEIEFVSDVDRNSIALILAKSPHVAYLCIKSDSSIEADDDCSHCSNGCGCDGSGEEDCMGCECQSFGHELVICAPAELFDAVLKDALQRINASPSNGRVNGSCGLHVHLDSRFHDNELMYEALFRNQKLLYSMVPASRKDGRYSKESEYDNFKDARNNTDRYQGINPHSYDKYRTIEVRLHSGTTNFSKISRWVRLLQAIGYATEAKTIDTLEDLFGCGVDPLTAIYCISRMKAFKDDHAAYSWLSGKDLAVFTNVLEASEAA